MRINSATVFASLVIGAILSSVAPEASAQEGVGAKYGAREPARCADMSEPVDGAPSNEQALEYLKCTMEGESGGKLYLLKDVTVQVAPTGSPYNPLAPIPDVDVTKPIFDIRGSLVQYQCEYIYSSRSNEGKNCTAYDQPKAKGACWKTTFGDWVCHMSDMSNRNREAGLPPLQ